MFLWWCILANSLATLTALTWDQVRNAGTFQNAIGAMDQSIQKYLISQNLDFSFVSFNAWDFRVHLPREAHDKGIMLPTYLEHPKTFDLRTEYGKWNAHHPEVAHHHPVSLGSICMALDVDPAYPMNSEPHRAMEEAVTAARALQALVCKLQPIELHSDVLSHPVDTQADIKAFLAERSKILYMSNLPHDTTQSELESWFTQYGGRPIAFWTMRTPDQHKPTGTGFALFSSHEEAIESLAMNGRALNERAIEVSPSGAMVLDRASEILTSFPPSKNRPRPGDWTCPSCGFSNFQRRTACFRCSYPVSNTANKGTGYGFGGSGEYGFGMNTLNSKKSNGNLNGNMYANANGQGFKGNVKYNAGTRVTSNNFSINNNGINLSRSNTVPANYAKGSKVSYGDQGEVYGPGSEINDGNDDINDNTRNNRATSMDKYGGIGEDMENAHKRINNNTTNNNSNNTNNNTGTVPFRAGDWKCRTEGCNYHNFAKNICCLRCGASRVSAGLEGNDMVGALPSRIDNEYGRGYNAPRRAASTSSYNNSNSNGANNNGFKSMQRRNVSMAAMDQLPTIPAAPELGYQYQPGPPSQQQQQQQQQQQMYRADYAYNESQQGGFLRRKSTRSHSMQHHNQTLKTRSSYQQFPQQQHQQQQHQQQQQQQQPQQLEYGMGELTNSFGTFSVDDGHN